MTAPANYTLAFADEFSALSVADTRTATANWYTAQAWGGGFGDALFMGQSSGRSPFQVVQFGGETALRIAMTRNASGVLESGLISSMFPDGTSRMPQDGSPYGYYEARLWLPDGRGVWPGFWALESERLSPNRDHVYEIDVLEQHGSAAADRYGTNLHDWDWNGTQLTGHTASPTQNVVGPGVLTTGWHTYGVEITPSTMTFSMDGRAYYSLPTPARLDTDPIFMINLAAGGGWPIDPKLTRADLYVDYFRAYTRAPGAQPTTPTGPTSPSAPSLVGSAGNDTFTVSVSGTRIQEAAAGGFDTARASVSYTLPENVEKLVLAEGAALDGTGNAAANQLYGNGSANTLRGLGGDDYLYGQGGDDTLSGDAGADKLYGGAGADRLIGGAEADRLQGDAGADTFVYLGVGDSTPLARDTIIDFSGAEADRLDLAAIDANALISGDQAFTWIGSAAFTGAGQLRYDRGILSGDIDGDRVADFSVSLGSAVLRPGDILL